MVDSVTVFGIRLIKCR